MYCQLYDLPLGRRQKKEAVSTTLDYSTGGKRVRQPFGKKADPSVNPYSKQARIKV
jgi:hypothetical protein